MRQAEKVDLGSDDWTMEIRPYASAFHFPIKELWEYRDLLFLFVRRDFKTMYKQTILGPAWILLSPLLTTGMFSLILAGSPEYPPMGRLHFCFIWQAIFCGTIFQAA